MTDERYETRVERARETQPADLSPGRPSRGVIAILIVVITTLAVIRLPFILYGPGAQDEQWFAGPGWTAAHDGVPRLSYAPTEDRQSVFYRADHVFYAVMPAFLYAQVPFHWSLNWGYTSSRMPSWLAGIGSLFLLFAIMRRLRVNDAIAVGAVGVCGMSRGFFFAWWNTRPDMLCSLFGLAALYGGIRFLDSPTRRLAVVIGLFVGLALLTHPFAIVFVIQVTGIVLLCRGLPSRQRCLCLLITGITAAAILCLWIPLILIDTEAFRIQFNNNVLSRTGPGLISRLLWPWGGLGFQVERLLDRVGVIQVAICGLSILAAVVTLLTGPNVYQRRAVTLGLSALYLHLACVGSHGMTDYWCYTWTWVVVLLAVGAQFLSEWIKNPVVRGSMLFAMLIAVLVALVPGSGVRTFWVYLTKSGSAEYNRREFCKEITDRLPADARLLVAADYVFEFEVLGRKPINAFTHRLYHDVSDFDFDYLVASRQNIKDGMPETLGGKRLWSFGNLDDPLSCYVEVYQRDTGGSRESAWPR